MVAPLHDAAGHVERFRAGVGCPQEPREGGVPVYELGVDGAAVFCPEKGGDGEHVLDLSGDLAEFDVFDQREDSCVLG